MVLNLYIFNFLPARYLMRIFRLIIIVYVATEIHVTVNNDVARNVESTFFVVAKFRYTKLIALSIIARCWTRFVFFQLLWTICLLPLSGGNPALSRVVIAHALKQRVHHAEPHEAGWKRHDNNNFLDGFNPCVINEQQRSGHRTHSN